MITKSYHQIKYAQQTITYMPAKKISQKISTDEILWFQLKQKFALAIQVL